MRLVPGLMLATLTLAPATASACSDASQMHRYFFVAPPKDVPVVRVRIVRSDWSWVDAELDGPFAQFSPNGRVRIALPSPPQGSNCYELGDIDGAVFVAVRELRRVPGSLMVEAIPLIAADWPVVERTGVAELDSYIVDPAMKARAKANRNRRKHD